jgi:hypothetical protein
VVWASVGKTLGFTPEGVINEIRRTARYTEADFRRIASDPPIDPTATMTRLRDILSEAEAFVARMPTGKAGLLFPKDGHGQRRGQWPTSAEIPAAIVERYNKPPVP